MSHASAASSSPVRKTIVASISDPSSAGRLSVGSVIRFHSSPIAAPDWRFARNQAPKVLASSDASAGSSVRSAAAARRAFTRSRRLSGAKRTSVGTRCSGAGSGARRRNAGGFPSRRIGTRNRGWIGTRCSTPRRWRKPRYAVQQRRSTCCPLSIQWSLRRTEYVAPPRRVRASNSVTLAPWSARSSAAAMPARPPPTTATRAPFTPRSARDSARARGPFPTAAVRAAPAARVGGAVRSARADGGTHPPSRARTRRCAGRGAARP